jgi:hypothetical protein
MAFAAIEVTSAAIGGCRWSVETAVSPWNLAATAGRKNGQTGQNK